MKKLIFIIVFLFSQWTITFADTSYFIDFTKVLNSSKPGAEAQKKLKQRIESDTKRFSKIESSLRKQESEIIAQKAALAPEEYQKKVKSLREKVSKLQKDKKDSFKNIAKSRNDAKKALLEAVNPIIKKYMDENKIRIVMNKQGVILGDSKLEITDQIISIINKEVSSLKIQ
jgi:Skp family chaperone for outer membrane proteins|tara:strand:+ start:76 stop:591 length:516 start_codon:yes stop_codon:yes gene_type:complete